MVKDMVEVEDEPSFDVSEMGGLTVVTSFAPYEALGSPIVTVAPLVPERVKLIAALGALSLSPERATAV